MEKWRNGIVIIKPKGKTVLPRFVEKDLVAKIATESCQRVVWLPRNAVIVPQDECLPFQTNFSMQRYILMDG